MSAAKNEAEGSAMEFNRAALEPLFMPWEFPNAHRRRADKDGQPPKTAQRRRPSPIVIANNLRAQVRDFRDSRYAGASDTTRELLHHWFQTDHAVETKDGATIPFRYYFCQREAMETLAYLYEARGIRTLSGLTGEFGGADAERAALGIDPAEDQWAKYAFKVATGAGKTKIMSLAVVWSYFHALREPDSEMARHFVVIAPNLTVFERLKEDFGDGRIFDTDPLIPSHWRGDWHMSVVLQDEASGAATGGVLYLTNIHRLYDSKKRRGGAGDLQPWAGPAVSRSTALDTGEALRERITSHKRLMVLNDEAHHVWDPDNAWNEAIRYLHEQTRKRGGAGLVSQLDFSATPKDNAGNLFKHIIVDTPLGEAVDGGIVKTPIIGRGDNLVEQASDNAAIRYQHHLMLGYNRWLESKKEWERSGKKPLMFVMCEDTEAADQIAKELNTNPLYEELNRCTINLHTNLKGKVKSRGRGKNKTAVFEESEKEISDEDLRALRELSRQLDEDTSPYLCIVSVLMLREGWDVRNVTTIVPLRPYSSKANILPEQTLGRGLRRMTPPGQVNETVTVVEHRAFTSLYREQLAQEGLFVEDTDVGTITPTTVTIYPDEGNKDLAKLDVQIPRLTPAHRITPVLEGLTLEDVRKAFGRYRKLPLGEAREEEINYEGRHLITNELIERMKVKLPLLENGFTAVTFYREELETACGIKGTHAVLAPLLQKFLEEILFGENVTLFDPRLCSRLADGDVREHIRAVFMPLIREKITTTEQRLKTAEPVSVTSWRPFQVTHSPRRPAEPAERTPFNLVPCNRELEVVFTHFADNASDVAAFCKNAGPQCLRIDYLAPGGRLAFYTPDFLVRKTDGHYLLVETKGRVDLDVPAKARAAAAWCKSASRKNCKWEYLYVPQGVFDQFHGNSIGELARTCQPAFQSLLKEEVAQPMLPFEQAEEAVPTKKLDEFISADDLASLPPATAARIEQAVQLFRFYENKTDLVFSPVFAPLLGPIDKCCEELVFDRLVDDVPKGETEQRDFFEPYMDLPRGRAAYLKKNASFLKKLLVYRSAIMPIGILRFCLEYADTPADHISGVFGAIRKSFRDLRGTPLQPLLGEVYDFRNKYVAHQDEELKDVGIARSALKKWTELVVQLEGLFVQAV